MSRSKKILLFFALFFASIEVKAQVSIDFIPAISGATLDGLMNVRLTNNGSKKIVKLEIAVNFEDEVGSFPIVQILTSSFEIKAGSNMVPPAIIRTAKVNLGTGSVADFLRLNGYFPSGQYSYEYKVFLMPTQELLIEQSFIHELQPAAPLNLVEPFDGDEICNQRPLLSWQPHIPLTNGAQYQVVLTEIKDKQKAVEALQYNLPLVNQKAIIGNLLMYPSVARVLEKDKKYAWQVTAYKGNTILNRSEIWSFTLSCSDSLSNEVPLERSYRDIEDLAKGNFYLAQGRLSFVIVNSYANQNLQYSIMCLTDPNIRIKELPKQYLVRGKNKIEIDLSKFNQFKEKHSYMLTVIMPNGQLKNLRFVYNE